MRRFWLVISAVVIIAITIFLALSIHKQPRTIIIQPLGYIDSELLTVTESHIKNSLGNVAIIRQSPVDLPTNAYYSPRNRYRAEKLLNYLALLRKDEESKIIGITSLDISTTKDAIYDWGVLGLGELGGSACVISTFRLKGNISNELFRQRFKKLVVHELGHTLGLDHCNAKQCVMQDYKGIVATLDSSKGDFCTTCKKHVDRILGNHLW